MPKPIAEIQCGHFRILGYTQAGEESFFAVPEMNLAFDMGRAPREVLAVDHVFLTHGHMDHAAGAAYYFSQRLFIEAPAGHLYAPEPLIDPLQRLLCIWGEIDGSLPPANLHVARAGQDIPLRRDLIVRPFDVHHPGRGRGRATVHALGYSVIEVRKKLRAEYLDLTGPQIVELKKKGVEITRRVEIPLIAYTGDTGPGDYIHLDHVRNSRVLLLECTFVAPEHRQRARAGNHVHLLDLVEMLPHLNNERILLTHLTRRTHLNDAREMARRELGDAYGTRVTFFMEHRRRARRGTRTEPRP